MLFNITHWSSTISLYQSKEGSLMLLYCTTGYSRVRKTAEHSWFWHNSVIYDDLEHLVVLTTSGKQKSLLTCVGCVRYQWLIAFWLTTVQYSANACLILELDLCAADRKQRPWKHYTHKTDNIGAMTLSNLMRGYCRWNHERMSQQDTDFSF